MLKDFYIWKIDLERKRLVVPFHIPNAQSCGQSIWICSDTRRHVSAGQQIVRILVQSITLLLQSGILSFHMAIAQKKISYFPSRLILSHLLPIRICPMYSSKSCNKINSQTCILVMFSCFTCPRFHKS